MKSIGRPSFSMCQSALEADSGACVEGPWSARAYFGSRNEPVLSDTEKLIAHWRLPIFTFLYRNSEHLVDRFRLPPRQFVKLGR